MGRLKSVCKNSNCGHRYGLHTWAGDCSVERCVCIGFNQEKEGEVMKTEYSVYYNGDCYQIIRKVTGEDYWQLEVPDAGLNRGKALKIAKLLNGEE